jgi:hypothetical protein
MQLPTNLGSILKSEEIPVTRVTWVSLLLVALLYGFIWAIPFTFLSAIGCGFVFRNKDYAKTIFACEYILTEDLRSTIIKFTLLFSMFYLGGLIWAMQRKSRLPNYSEKTVIYEHGFFNKKFIRNPSHAFYIFQDVENEVICRYQDVAAVNLRISTDPTLRRLSESDDIMTRSKVKDQVLVFYHFSKKLRSKEFRRKQSSDKFSSSSKALASVVLSKLEEFYWTEIKDKIYRGEEVSFGSAYVSKNYVALGYNKNDIFPLHEIQQIGLAIDGGEVDTWDFFVSFKEEAYKHRMRFAPFIYPSIHVPIGRVDNPHLFLKSLATLGIPFNLDQTIGIDKEWLALLKKYADLT